MSKYREMTYGELKEAAKKLDLPASGNKEQLLERLEGADPEGTPVETEEEETHETPEDETPDEPVAQKPVKVSDRDVEKGLRGDAQKMKDHLAKQRKISIIIPMEPGVSPEIGEKIPFVVNMNGYRLSIKRGVYVEVPEQVAQMIMERLESEGKVGRSSRIDRDANTIEALG